ncbi:MAG: hypothetical protein R3229_11735 [Alphaproteobacteria bacterium]|nr:hypothetical protein [Alphaproteobacteria bacterium]
MSAGVPPETARPFPVWGAAKETFVLLWRNKLWFLIRALPPAVIGGVTFIITFPRIGVYAVWEMALFFLTALFVANMMVSCHRMVMVDDSCRRFADFLPRITDLTYVSVWLLLSLAKYIFDILGALLGQLVALAGRVFDLGVAILFFIVLARLIALFPLIAIQVKTPFRTAWRLSAGHIGQLIGFCLVVGTALLIAVAAVAALVWYSQLWLAEGGADGWAGSIGVEFATTLPFFVAALFLMIVCQAVAVAQSVAYGHLAELRRAD